MKKALIVIMVSLAAVVLADAETKHPKFFEGESPVAFRLEAPIRKLNRQKTESPEWLEGKVYLTQANGEERVFDVKVRGRGRFRRLRSSCSFPPYWINFRKSQVKGTVFAGLDRVKVVTHCRETRKSFEPYVYKEYLTYKTYGLITEKSFRVRLVTVEYVDTDKPRESRPHAGFFIEHVDDLAKRNDMKEIRDRYILPSYFNPNALCRAEFFQFLIGNTDFSFVGSDDRCCHNSRVFSAKEGYVPVPYDFDHTGMVNVPYAVINPKFPIDSLRDRLYRGFQVPDDVLQDTINHYLARKEDILRLWSTAAYLPNREQTESIEFIEAFYKIIETPALLERMILRRMRDLEKVEKLNRERMDELEDS